MTRDLVILDLDGTLLDTRRRHYAAYVQAAEAIGLAAMPAIPFWIAKRRARPWAEILARSTGDATPDQAAFLARFVALIETPELLALDRPQPGARRALARLRAAGLGRILVTSRRSPNALTQQLSELGLASAFDLVIATIGRPKHDVVPPALARRARHWIGDTEEDLAAARQLGIDVALVANGIRDRRFLQALGAQPWPSVGAAVGSILT